MEQTDVIGIIIPQDCKNIYVFQNEEDFFAQIRSGKMVPLYGNEDYQKKMNLFVAYVP